MHASIKLFDLQHAILIGKHLFDSVWTDKLLEILCLYMLISCKNNRKETPCVQEYTMIDYYAFYFSDFSC